MPHNGDARQNGGSAHSPRLHRALSVTVLAGITTRPAIAPAPAVPVLGIHGRLPPGSCRGSDRRQACHGPEPLPSPCPRARRLGRHAGRLAGMRQWRVRIYRSQVTLPAALTAPPVLQEWSAWRDLRGAGRDRCIPAGPGLYRIRRAGGEPGLDYIGQAGRSLRGRLGQLGGVYRTRVPYRDPRTAGPALWALRHRDGRDFEVAVIEVPGTVPQRKALEAAAITVYRLGSGRFPAASFGRLPAGYRISSGNNARLAAAGRRFRGGPDPAVPAGPAYSRRTTPILSLSGTTSRMGHRCLLRKPIARP